jgi:hypothetical protein
MQSLDTKFAAHVGAELIVIGGVFFWFKRTTDKLDEQNKQLVTQVKQLEDMVGQLRQLVGKHEAILTQVLGGAPRPLSPPQPPRSLPPSPPPEPDVDPSFLDDALSEELSELKPTSQKTKRVLPAEIEVNAPTTKLKKKVTISQEPPAQSPAPHSKKNVPRQKQK